jgi:antitoxin component YwqK of YwqJK toxin-antitoxin module
VQLEMETEMEKEYYTFFEKDSDTPYSGKYISESTNDIVTIDFKNGKKDGEFIRLNNQGDTTEFIKYKNGRNISEINSTFKEGKLIEQEVIKNIKGSSEDKQIFDKVKDLLISSNYYELDDFLNPLFGNSYKSKFNNLKNQFGNLKSIEIDEITKKLYPYNSSEHMRAKIKFNFEDIQLNSTFLIVKEIDGKLKGQAFTHRPIARELLPDSKIDEVIDILIKKDVDRFLSIKHIDEKHRKEIDDYLNDFGKISSDYKFLNTEFLIGEIMVYLKNYLVEIDGEKQILTLKYNATSKNTLDLRLFYLSPHRRPFEVMHY